MAGYLAGDAVRTAEELRRVPPPQMTDEEFLANMEHNYRRAEHSPGVPCLCFSLLQFTGMTDEEYAAWIMHGAIPERVMRAAGRRGPR